MAYVTNTSQTRAKKQNQSVIHQQTQKKVVTKGMQGDVSHSSDGKWITKQALIGNLPED